MMKNKHPLILRAVVLATAAIVASSLFANRANATISAVELKLGSKSVAVSALQTLLIQNGYLKIASPTGYFGPITQAAVKAVQAAQNIPETGVVNIPSSSLSTFFAAAAAATPSSTPAKFGSTGQQVTSLQTFLIQKGYLKIASPTAYFGSLTQAALKAFQAAHDIPQTGVFDSSTLAVMNGK